jgi:hypothetical protein
MSAPPVNAMGSGYGRGNTGMNSMGGGMGGAGAMGGGMNAGLSPVGGMNPMARGSNAFDPFGTLDMNSSTKSNSSQYNSNNKQSTTMVTQVNNY